MARTAADVRAIFDVMEGPDADDALSSPSIAEFSAGNLAGLRVGILESEALGKATSETTAAVNRAGSLLGAQDLQSGCFANRWTGAGD